jgi:hypothetical protein
MDSHLPGLEFVQTALEVLQDTQRRGRQTTGITVLKDMSVLLME